jgi:hypothetical protein
LRPCTFRRLRFGEHGLGDFLQFQHRLLTNISISPASAADPNRLVSLNEARNETNPLQITK